MEFINIVEEFLEVLLFRLIIVLHDQHLNKATIESHSMPTIDTLIFDLDDTLIHSNRYFIQLNQQLARRMGLRVPAAEEIIAYGQSWEDFITKTWPGINIAMFQQEYYAIADSVHYTPIEGVHQALEQLERYDKYILTKRARSTIGLRLQQTRIDKTHFVRIYCNEDVKYKKPDPRCFQEIFENVERRKGTRPRSSILAIGDRPDDYLAARRAGIPFVGVRSEYTKEQELLDEGLPTENIIDSVAMLPGYLRIMNG